MATRSDAAEIDEDDPTTEAQPEHKATATFSLAVQELVFLQTLISDLIPLLAPSDGGGSGSNTATSEKGSGKTAERSPSPDPTSQLSAAAIFTEEEENTAVNPNLDPVSPGGRRVSVEDIAEAQAERQNGALPSLHLELRCDGGVWIRFIDDAEDALMPLYEVGVRQIAASLQGTLGESEDVTVDGGDGGITLISGQAQVAMSLEASHFNGNNGHWEPIVEPWHIEGGWIGTDITAEPEVSVTPAQQQRRRSVDSEGNADDDEEEGNANEGESSTNNAPATANAEPVHSFTLAAAEVLDVNVTHAFLISLIAVGRIVAAAHVKQARQIERQRQAQKAKERREQSCRGIERCQSPPVTREPEGGMEV